MAFGDFHLSKNYTKRPKSKAKAVNPPAVDQPDKQPAATANDDTPKPKS